MVERPGGVRKEQGVVGFEREALGEQRVGLGDSRPPNEALRWDQKTLNGGSSCARARRGFGGAIIQTRCSG